MPKRIAVRKRKVSCQLISKEYEEGEKIEEYDSIQFNGKDYFEKKYWEIGPNFF